MNPENLALRADISALTTIEPFPKVSLTLQRFNASSYNVFLVPTGHRTYEDYFLRCSSPCQLLRLPMPPKPSTNAPIPSSPQYPNHSTLLSRLRYVPAALSEQDDRTSQFKSSLRCTILSPSPQIHKADLTFAASLLCQIRYHIP